MPATAPATRSATAPVNAASKRAPLWLTLIEGAGALFIAIVALEVMFYFAGIGDQEYLKPNQSTGYSPMEGKHVTWRQEGFSRTVFNSHGMRDLERSVSKPANDFRIAVLGDSYVEALQVDRSQSFCQLLEDSLNSESSGTRYEVMNFGVSGYNLGQIYLRLRDLALSFHPDLVLLAIRMDQPPQLDPNPTGGFTFARPTFCLGEDGKLIEDDKIQAAWMKSAEGRRMQLTAWLREKSRLWGVISTCAQYLIKAKSPLLSNYHESPVEEQWPVAHALIAECKSLCERNGCRLAVIALPGPGPQHSLQQLSLIRYSAELLAVPFLDLRPTFDQAAKSRKDLFFVCHMTAKGHQLLTKDLSRFLRQRELVTSAPAPHSGE